jgi:hypothetical protein
MFQEETGCQGNGFLICQRDLFDHPSNKGVFVSHHSLFFSMIQNIFFVVYKHIT